MQCCPLSATCRPCWLYQHCRLESRRYLYYDFSTSVQCVLASSPRAVAEVRAEVRAEVWAEVWAKVWAEEAVADASEIKARDWL